MVLAYGAGPAVAPEVPVEILLVHRASAVRSSRVVVHEMGDTFAVCEASGPGRPVPQVADRSYAVVRSTDLDFGIGEDLAVGARFRDASVGPEVAVDLPVPVVLACALDPASDDYVVVAFPVAFRGHPFPFVVDLPEAHPGRLVHRVVLPVVPFPWPFHPCSVPVVLARSIDHPVPVESVWFSVGSQTGSVLASSATLRPDSDRAVPSSEVVPSRIAYCSPNRAKPRKNPWTVRWHGFQRTSPPESHSLPHRKSHPQCPGPLSTRTDSPRTAGASGQCGSSNRIHDGDNHHYCPIHPVDPTTDHFRNCSGRDHRRALLHRHINLHLHLQIHRYFVQNPAPDRPHTNQYPRHRPFFFHQSINQTAEKLSPVHPASWDGIDPQTPLIDARDTGEPIYTTFAAL